MGMDYFAQKLALQPKPTFVNPLAKTAGSKATAKKTSRK